VLADEDCDASLDDVVHARRQRAWFDQPPVWLFLVARLRLQQWKATGCLRGGAAARVGAVDCVDPSMERSISINPTFPKRISALAAALVACLGLAMAASAGGEMVGAGNLAVSFNGAITPVKLPRSSHVPIAIHFDGSFRTTDGSRLPDLNTVSIKFDRHGLIDTEGLPTCTAGELKSTLPTQAKRVCGGAFIGAGKVSAEITFPEQPFFNATGPLMIFNGVSTHGRHTLLMYVFAEVPVPSTYVTEVTVAQRPTGPVLSAELPTIDGGYGHISSFDVSLGRKFQTGGRTHSFLSAACPAPSGLPGASFTFARASYSFADGTSLNGTVQSHCEVGGGR
jgi:hypothetical protein